MAIHTANEVKPDYSIWIRLILINVLSATIIKSWSGSTYLLAFDSLYLWFYSVKYRVTEIKVEHGCLNITQVNVFGRKRSYTYTDIENIDITYRLKPIPKQPDGFVLICYHETFRDFILFPDVDGWTEESVGVLALDFEQSGYRVNSSDDIHVF